MLWAAFVCIGALEFAGGTTNGDQPDAPQGIKDAADVLNLP